MIEVESVTGQLFKDDSPFLNMTKFSEIIEKIVLENRISHMDAILHFCKENSVEIEDVTPFISELLKQKIQQDAIEAGLMPKQNQLPL